MTYEKKYYLKATDFDRYLRIKPTSVLEILQDVAGSHAETFGAGLFDFMKKARMWVVVRNKYVVVKQPERYTTITAETWPLASRGVKFRREFILRNESGEVLIKASSEWAVVSTETRSIILAKDVYPQTEILRVDQALEEKLESINEQEQLEKSCLINPTFSDIDVNGHVNNTKYAQYILDAISPDEKGIVSFQIDYHKEVLQDEKLTLLFNECSPYVVKGVNEKGEKTFVAKVVYE